MLRLLGPAVVGLAILVAASPAAGQKRLPTHSSPIAISRDGRLVWVTNPRNDTVSIIRTRTNRVIRTVRVGDEPRSIALTPDGKRAFVANAAGGGVTVLRIRSGGRASVAQRGRSLTGAEPWNIVATPDSRRVFVANSGQDTITVIDATRPRILGKIDLSKGKCNPGFGSFQPRGLAVTADSRRLWVTSFFSHLLPGALEATDTGQAGAVCAIDIKTRSRRLRDYRPAGVVGLAPRDAGFTIDKTGDGVPDPTFAFPNQLQSIVIRGNRAFLPNIAASPEGPIAFNVNTQAFLNVIDGIRGKAPRDAGAINLHLGAREPEAGRPKLFFANPWAIAFTNQRGRGNAYVVSAGSDLLVKLNVSPTGQVSFTVDDNTTRYIDLNDPGAAATSGANAGKNPQGIVITPNGRQAYVANVGSGNVSVVDLRSDRVTGVIRTSPAPRTPAEAMEAAGRELFFTSRGHFDRPAGTTVSTDARMSQEGWQSCSSCHFEGWTDGVVWQFGSGPRKSVPLNATFDPDNPDDQRILNYSAIFDEVEDFELNIRNVSGSGNLDQPQSCSQPPPPFVDFNPHQGLLIGDNGDRNLVPCRIGAFQPPNAGRPQHTVTLPGAAPVPGLTALKEWVRFAIRTPDGAVQPSDDVTAGRRHFMAAGCQQCHGGPKWTASFKDFASPPAAAEIATETNPQPQSGAQPVNTQYLHRFLRDIGSFKLGPPASGVGAEEKAAPVLFQGQAQPARAALGIDHNGDGKGNGYNVPSLLGIGMFPPYYHGGACQTLDCVVGDVGHRTAKGTRPDTLTDARARRELVAFIKSISDGTPAP